MYFNDFDPVQKFAIGCDGLRCSADAFLKAADASEIGHSLVKEHRALRRIRLNGQS